jgi:hypothetical protein
MTAALGAYGGAVLAQVRDEAADATVGLGRRLLLRIFGSRDGDEALPAVLAEVVENPGDDDVLAVLRLTIRQALEAAPAMVAEVRSMLSAAPAAAVSQNVSAGRDAYVAGRDMNITRHDG